MPSLPTREGLAKLPLRAIVAYATRRARRVQPLFHNVPLDASERERHEQAIEKALSFAESWCSGRQNSGPGLFVANVAKDAANGAAFAADAAYLAANGADDANGAFAAKAAADAAKAAAFAATAAAYAANDAAYAANDANDANDADDAKAANAAACAAEAAYLAADGANDAFAAKSAADAEAAAAADYCLLLSLSKDRFYSPDDPIDPRETGPLGALWPRGAANWFARRGAGSTTSSNEPPSPADTLSLTIIVDGSVAPGLFAEFLAGLSSVYSELSDGDELVIREGLIPVLDGVCV